MKFKIAVLGTGNVAWHLSQGLEEAGHQITEVFGRTLSSAQKLTERLYTADAKTDLDFSDSAASIYILAVSDDAITEIADEIILPEESLLIHTSGAVGLDVLSYSSATYTGVFYPLQTFSKSRKLSLDEVPFLLESDDQKSLDIMKRLAKSLSPHYYFIKSRDRMALHVAAVFASNFSNHMMRIAEEIMGRQGLDYEMLKPLIIETISKSLEIGARKAQTGPAKRSDFETLEQHHQFLNYNEQLAEIYKLVSQDIIDSY